MLQEYKLYRTCVDHSQNEVYKLHDMIDSAREITFKTFTKHCDWKSFAETIYAIGSQKGLHLKDDWSVSFYKSKYDGKKCYYMRYTGLGEVEGELTVRGLENVGKKKITEKRTVNSGVRSYDKNILKEWLIENCQEEGWIIDPYIGSQGSVVYENNSDAIINYTVYKYE